MRRVCKIGGPICATECHWKSAVIRPPIHEVLASMKLAEDLTSLKKPSPYGGKARSWTEGAGSNAGDVQASAAMVYFLNSEAIWWGEIMARQLKQVSSLGRGSQKGLIDEDQREKMPTGWRKWAGQTDTQIICKRS